MADETQDVNLVTDPSAVTTPEVPETPAGAETPPPESVIPGADATPKPEATPEAPEPKDDNPMIPRGRLNEEIRKRHALEERLKALEESRDAAPVPPQAPPLPQKDDVEVLAEQMSAEAGEDEYGNRILPVKAAIVTLRTQMRMQYAATAGQRLEKNISDFVKANPRAVRYTDKIRAELSKLEVGVRDNPVNVGRKYKELLGEDIEVFEKEAEERGRTKALEQKRIVSQAAGESPSGMPDGKNAGDMLSADEKRFADKNKISYEDYHKSKGNKRV